MKEKGRNKKYRRDVDATSEVKAHRELFNKSVTIDDAQNLLYIVNQFLILKKYVLSE